MTDIIKQDIIEKKIFLIRGLSVMLDRDLAELYGVKTKSLNLLNCFSNDVDVEKSVHLSSIIESCVNIGLPGISIIIQLSSN